MSRELRRVPLGFDWPISKVWQGYLLPENLRSDSCTSCAGTGTTSARQWVDQITHLLLMLDDDLRAQSLGRPMHPYFHDTGSRAYGGRPSADITEFGTGLAGRPGSFMGHDAIDGWSAVKKVIQAAGLDPETWGICATCEGHGSVEKYPGQREEADAWEPTDPPTGEGWQAWETTSEGSPCSPVFATPGDLIVWASGPNGRLGIGGSPVSEAAARAFVGAEWAPSMVATPETGLLGGVEWLGATAGESA
jgi:hypothetical protein